MATTDSKVPSGIAQHIKALAVSADVLAQRGEITDAEQIYRQILAAAPYHSSALSFLATRASAKGSVDEALAMLDKAIQGNPNDALLFESRAIISRGLGRLDAAVADLNTAIALKPDLYTAHLHRAFALKDTGDYNAAVSAVVAIWNRLSNPQWMAANTAANPRLEELAVEAADLVRAAQVLLVEAELEPVTATYGKEALSRVFGCVASFGGSSGQKSATAAAQTRILNVEGLENKPIFAEESFACVTLVRDDLATFRQELQSLLQDRGMAVPNGNGEAIVSSRRDAPVKYLLNLTDPQKLTAPTLSSLLANPGLVSDIEPSALILIPPGRHVVFQGPGENWVLTAYIALDVPGTLDISVEPSRLPVTAGEAVVASNQVDHSVEFDGAGTCMLLALPVWHPSLSKAETDGLAGVLRGFARFREKYR